jgi:AcrR family transcriptional regulator
MRKKITKEDILNAAFSEWGKYRFKKMSLKQISDKLKISKTALYRYYASKEELLNCMDEFLIKDISKISQEFIDESKNIAPLETISLYIEKYFRYFASNIHFFYFYLLYYSHKLYSLKKKEYSSTVNEINNIFAGAIKEIKSWIKPEMSDFFVKFLFSTGIFVLNNTIYNTYNKEIKKSLDDKGIEDVINKIKYITLNGIASHKPENIDFEEIEKKYFIKINILKRDQIFDAIASVVAKHGIWNASIGKIAEEMKTSRSNLYFYFKNKNAMINEMIYKEFVNIDNIMKENSSQYTAFEEKLYISVLALASYMISDKKILSVFDWLHYQQKEMNKSNMKNNFFLYNLLESNFQKYFDSKLFNAGFLTGFLSMHIVKEIFLSELYDLEIDAKYFRYIYKYFFSGLNQIESK